VIITYPQHLLKLARKLIDDGEFNVSVVVLHMAGEIAVERSFSDICTKKAMTIPTELKGYNLARKENRKIYTSLTGDQIQQKPFWQKFTESTKRRNSIIHSDHRIKIEQAEESFSAVSKFVAHIEK
jgi:hypothetical protein